MPSARCDLSIRRIGQIATVMAILCCLGFVLQVAGWHLQQHNARAIYHWIMVRGLVALVQGMSPEHGHAALIRDRPTLAIEPLETPAGVASAIRVTPPARASRITFRR